MKNKLPQAWFENAAKLGRKIEDKQFRPECPKCKIGKMSLIHDQYGLYYQCPHCKYDTGGVYKDKDKYK